MHIDSVTHAVHVDMTYELLNYCFSASLTYSSSILRMTSESTSPRSAATRWASSHNSSGTRTVLILPPMRRVFDVGLDVGESLSDGDDPATDAQYPLRGSVSWLVAQDRRSHSRTPVVCIYKRTSGSRVDSTDLDGFG